MNNIVKEMMDGYIALYKKYGLNDEDVMALADYHAHKFINKFMEEHKKETEVPEYCDRCQQHLGDGHDCDNCDYCGTSD